MQLPPLALIDFTLLLVVAAIVLLFTSELASPYYGQNNLIIDKQKLKNVAILTAIVSFVFVSIRVLGILLG